MEYCGLWDEIDQNSCSRYEVVYALDFFFRDQGEWLSPAIALLEILFELVTIPILDSVPYTRRLSLTYVPSCLMTFQSISSLPL